VRSVISAVVICPDSLLTYGLVHLLREAHYRVAGVARDFTELRISASESEPEVFILVLPDDKANLAGVAHVQRQSKTAKIVVLSDRINPATRAAVMSPRGIAYLSRWISKDAFVKFLGLVAAGEVVVSPELLTRKLALRADAIPSQPRNGGGVRSSDETVSRLSPREAEILERIVDGDSNKHISRRLDIAETTVKVHVKSILRKINVHNRTQAAIWALNHGISMGVNIMVSM
jgi:two-component system nitrate/nitrite response regulator NarL